MSARRIRQCWPVLRDDRRCLAACGTLCSAIVPSSSLSRHLAAFPPPFRPPGLATLSLRALWGLAPLPPCNAAALSPRLLSASSCPLSRAPATPALTRSHPISPDLTRSHPLARGRPCLASQATGPIKSSTTRSSKRPPPTGAKPHEHSHAPRRTLAARRLHHHARHPARYRCKSRGGVLFGGHAVVGIPAQMSRHVPTDKYHFAAALHLWWASLPPPFVGVRSGYLRCAGGTH